MIPDKNNKVLLGLSGGVDSTAAALLLKKDGFDVTGFFFDVLGDQADTAKEAEKIATALDIKLIYKDVSAVFRNSVIRYFCESYMNGQTPNPCIFCNENIKFRILRETADEIGAYHLATGHYARIHATRLFYIRRGVSEKKDQSYMLYRLGQNILSRLILPLGSFQTKEEVRDIVRGYKINNAEKKDSQEICFIKDGDYVNFIKQQGYESLPGDFADRDGNRLGKHLGILHYTVGQRKGLGITFGKPVFVTKVDSKKNMVTLSTQEDLFTSEVYSKNNVFTDSPVNVDLHAKIRYAAPPAPCTISFEADGCVKTTFQTPQRAATPGQSIVFYDGDLVVGGGIIHDSFSFL